MALSSPGTSARRREYQVFLSFRGSDTRLGFVSHLYDKLHNLRGIRTFKDDQDLEKGTTISPGLLRAIERSHFAIIVLSADYASSSWCLDELTRIVQCMEAGKILPVFYNVEPITVRKQTGSFAQAFMEHETKFSQEKVEEWRAALKTVADLSGWHLDGNKSESDLIDEVVNCVWMQVRHIFKLLDWPHKFVGRDFALNQLRGLLALGENDVRFIGITGMGGIGKTTLARRVFDSISHDFDVHCFLANVREVSTRDGTLVGLQNQLLSTIFKQRVVEVWDEQDGVTFIINCLCNKKVLLVLDDVDQLNQLEILAGKKCWFGNGSRIILTTRVERLLVQHDITLSYKVEGMSDDEALELFSLKAFKQVQPDEEFSELSEHFVNHAKGVPLVLVTLGSFLYLRERDAWQSVLDNLRNIPNPKVFDSLKVSYDGLQGMEQRIFLDIALFHIGKDMEQVVDILNRRFSISSLIVIDILIERSLLTMSDHMCLEMHDLIQEMGREIVVRESEEPGKRTRIWLLSDLRHVLTAKTGTDAIEAIVVNAPKLEQIRCNSEAFSNMHGLRLIKLDNVMIISSAPIFPPRYLRIIYWSLYPFKFLSKGFPTHYLTELSLPKSKLVQLWDGRKDFPNLKYMDLSGSDKLTSTPDFTGIPNLQRLRFAGCKNLVHIHPSIAILKSLKHLSLGLCKSIKSLPSALEMDSLEVLMLNDCSKLKKVPEFSEQMKRLDWLVLDRTGIEKLPSSIENLVALTGVELKGCKRLCVDWCSKVDKDPRMMERSLVMKKNNNPLYSLGQDLLSLFGIRKSSTLDPQRRGLMSSSLNRLCCLETLNLRDCNLSEGSIPEDIGCLSSLRGLYLGGNNFVSLPTSIRCLSKLQTLHLLSCKRLRELPHLPPLSRKLLLNVDVSNCTSLQRLTDPSKLSSRFTNLFDYDLFALNCIRLVEDEGWISYVLSTILRWATDEDLRHLDSVVLPGSEIPEWFPGSELPEWFSNKSEELPPRECTNWLGIAFCVVFAEPEQTDYDDRFEIECSFGNWRTSYRHVVSPNGHLESEHVWVFYLPRELWPEAKEEILFRTIYGDADDPSAKVGVNMVKKWEARLVVKQDLEELKQRLKIHKRTHEYYCEEEDLGGSAIFDDQESNCKRQKQE